LPAVGAQDRQEIGKLPYLWAMRVVVNSDGQDTRNFPVLADFRPGLYP